MYRLGVFFGLCPLKGHLGVRWSAPPPKDLSMVAWDEHAISLEILQNEGLLMFGLGVPLKPAWGLLGFCMGHRRFKRQRTRPSLPCSNPFLRGLRRGSGVVELGHGHFF